MTALRLLLVEDNPLTRKLVRRTLEKADVELHEAANGVEAMAAFSECRPHLVLQDLVLPDLSGFDLLKRMRALSDGANIPILAFTGLMSRDDEAQISSAGFDGLITKPVEPSRLLHLLRGHLPIQATEHKLLGAGRRLLVADDDPQQLKITRFRLSRLGFLVETATDGQEALEIARRFKPHIILTDALMPKLDGFGLCLEIRRDPGLHSVPIVLATSSYVEPEDQALARRAGANAFVVRTADLGDIVHALEGVLRESRGPAALGPATDSSPALDSDRATRTVRQLERQVALNSGLAQRCSILSAELCVLSTVAEALVNARDLESALFDILANCLDAAGTSRGAIYLSRADGVLALRASHGLDATSRIPGQIVTADAQRLALETRPVVVWNEVLANPSEEALPRAVLLPLSARGTLVGAMLLDRPESSESNEDWIAFARAIANQVSLAVSLARSFARIEASEQRARGLMDHAGDGILVATEDGRIVEANHAAERILGEAEPALLGRMLPDSISEGTIRRADGTAVSVEYTSALVPSGQERLRMMIVRDVSERNALAAQLRQAQKMEALGRLAGGVAHDFNNVLSVVISYSDLLLSDMEGTDPRAEDVIEIQKAGQRAAEMTRQLLAFSRQRVTQLRITDVGDAVVAAKNMLQRIIGADVMLEIDVATDLGKVLSDESQLHQVILNLVVNARDAMPAGGKIRVGVSNADVADPMASPANIRPGRYVLLTVADEGTGMDEETRSRIFEPFFTTKEPGKGTGLGLATVFGIVDQAGGTVCVESSLGAGSTFSVYLPRALGKEQPASEALPPPVSRGTETVLVVEVEDQVRALIAKILRRSGYRVIETASPGEALLAAEQLESKIDLLLTDVVMPRMDGRHLAERLLRGRPHMNVLFMSGLLDGSAADQLVDLSGSYLQKPFTTAQLLSAIRMAVERGGESAA